ncbi:MAG TPA: hypothetical protein VM076_14525 [Gemmatimonadaceae bacterium]|nr:hypothetical protein [Gemmatimonadaceae bacterium]
MRQSEPLRALVAICATLAVSAASAAAQMPTVPVVQNGFGSTGMTLAVNYGSTTGSTAYALAVGWGPASARFQISAALGGVRPDTGANWTGYGLRAAVPLFTSKSDRIGVAAFGGVGGARRDTTSIVRVPVGIGAGYRFPLGETRSVAAYAAPFFVWSRLSEQGARAQGDNAMRGSVGADLVLTRNIGLTAGYEFGGKGDGAALASAGGIFGAAVSYAFR